ncbi:hypothetical protein BLOT_015104 [Blomia tropicalis]|nr:hypothetical protein BLOT_015104 [Blomia tropicalis]
MNCGDDDRRGRVSLSATTSNIIILTTTTATTTKASLSSFSKHKRTETFHFNMFQHMIIIISLIFHLVIMNRYNIVVDCLPRVIKIESERKFKIENRNEVD